MGDKEEKKEDGEEVRRRDKKVYGDDKVGRKEIEGRKKREETNKGRMGVI